MPAVLSVALLPVHLSCQDGLNRCSLSLKHSSVAILGPDLDDGFGPVAAAATMAAIGQKQSLVESESRCSALIAFLREKLARFHARGHPHSKSLDPALTPFERLYGLARGRSASHARLAESSRRTAK